MIAILRSPRRRRLCAGLALPLLAVPLLVGAAAPADPLDLSIAGIGAKLACSGVFVSGRPLDDVVRDDIVPLLPPLREVRYAIDREHGTVTATRLAGERTAQYRAGLGCTLLDAGRRTLPPRAPIAPLRTDTTARWPAGERVDPRPAAGVDRARLDAAVAAAFTASARSPDTLATRAIVVVHRGRIVAERYAPGFSAQTRLLGWSMSKSVTASLFGIAEHDGLISRYGPAPVAEWARPDDPRHAISADDLLHMSSGLRFDETYAPGNDVTAMLFDRTDMAAYAAGLPLAHPPGTAWSYSSGTTNILSRMIADALGGTATMQAYARRRLFEPAGMRSVVFEEDASGTPVGSSYVYATARDWARLGLLYLNRGTINGRRLLDARWIDYVRTPAPADPLGHYGAQFWLNGTARVGSAQRTYPHLPADAYAALGHNGQAILVVPSRQVVLVRLGWTTDAVPFDIDATFAPIIASLR